MSDAPRLRILPADQSQGAPTPEQTIIEDHLEDTDIEHPLLNADVVEIKDEEPDTGALLDKVLDSRAWPAGARVGDGTPGPGRKAYDIDERIVFAMAAVGGTNMEIAAQFGCSETVIQKRFGELIKRAKASRKIRLRQKQYQKALEGDTGMLIWLGKQELGQTDERHLRFGDLSRFSDEELAQIAQGKVPGQLGAGKAEDDK